MKKIGLFLMYTGTALTFFGIGWMIGMPIRNIIMREICNKTMDIKGFCEHDCVKFMKEKNND